MGSSLLNLLSMGWGLIDNRLEQDEGISGGTGFYPAIS
jgi:hypothetical protein